MSVQITIPLSALRDARVAGALSELMLALGEPGDVPDRSPRRRRSAPAVATGTSAAPAARRSAPKKAPAPVDNRPEPIRFEEFVSGLPDRSQKFLNLLKKRGSVTMSEAMAALDITASKALGGITGSIGRWMPRKDLQVPFKAGQAKSGERMWTWIRTGGGASRSNSDDLSPPAPSAIAEAAPPKPPSGPTKADRGPGAVRRRRGSTVTKL